MKTLCRIVAVSALAVTLTGGVTFAQNHPTNQQHQQKYVKHSEWKKGSHIQSSDWNRGAQVDWKAHHLRQPPNGYQWRQVDGNYVLANPGGVIFSVSVAR